MVDISGPNRKATFAGTQSIGRGIQGPSQIGLAGLNFLANQQQQTASQQYQDQLMRQQELQSILGQQSNRNELVESVLAEIRQSDTPSSGMVAQSIGTNLLGFEQGELARRLNTQGAITNQQQNVADVQNTQSQAAQRRTDAGLVPLVQEGAMREILSGGARFDPRTAGIDEGRTAEQVTTSGQGGIEASFDAPAAGGRQVQFSGPANRLQEMRQLADQASQTSTPQRDATEQGGFNTGETPSSMSGPAGNTPGQVGNEQQTRRLRELQDQMGWEQVSPPQVRETQSGQQFVIAHMRDPQTGEADQLILDENGAVIGHINENGEPVFNNGG